MKVTCELTYKDSEGEIDKIEIEGIDMEDCILIFETENPEWKWRQIQMMIR